MSQTYYNELYITMDTDHSQGYVEGFVTENDDSVIEYLDVYGEDENVMRDILSSHHRVAVLKNIKVEGGRNKGVGSSLLGKALGAIDSENAGLIVLIADEYEDNPFSLEKWYSGYGFETVMHINQGPIMVLEL